MLTIELDVSLKARNEEDYPEIQAKQGDVGRKFRVYLKDNGVDYIIPDGATFSVWYFGTSGEGNYTMIGERSAFYINGNCVTVELITQMLLNDGGGTLCLIMNTQDGSQLGLWNIPYSVEKVRGSNSVEAKQYYNAFAEYVGMAVQSAIRAEQAAEKFDILKIYPIGAIYMSTVSTSPEDLFGGAWVQLKDSFLLGAGDHYEAGVMGGESEHTLTVNELPSHSHATYRVNNGNVQAGSGSHVVYVGQDWSQGYINTFDAGANASHNNMPPYLAVYMWKRVG